jgi:dTDP-glucose 4,6-dehydratase
MATKNQNKKQAILVTGGAGFIGSHMVDLLVEKGHPTIILDKLTYAGKRENLSGILKSDLVQFVVGDINDKKLVLELLHANSIQFLMNFAAETHVDNSILEPSKFIETNILGTTSLLEACKEYQSKSINDNFKFIQISTDEVFGELTRTASPFDENTRYQPNSPYSASKASADHLVRAWHKTYNIPTVTTHCSNNFGPRQDLEKLIPKITTNAIKGLELPIYGDGTQIREWIYVADHCEGIYKATKFGIPGQSYCFGGELEIQNISLVKKICNILETLHPKSGNGSYVEQIKFIGDRPGHDFRYAINDTKARKKLGYWPQSKFNCALMRTVSHYLEKHLNDPDL